jgi:hypothetical protein
MFVIGDSATDETQPVAFVLSIFVGVDSVFVGLSVTPGFALVDTGAQHGVVGKNNFRQLVETLAIHGLKPRPIETLRMTAAGVGGATTFNQSAEVPVGIGGVRGTLTAHVIHHDTPLLLPISVCKSLGMILDLPETSIHWKTIGRDSDIHEMSEGGHSAIDIFEFLSGAWRNLTRDVIDLRWGTETGIAS